MPVKNRIPPHNLEAEESVLGALLLDREAASDVAEFLRSEHFYKPANGLVYEAMLELYSQREPIDVVTVANRLKKNKALDKVGGAGYLTDLAGKVPTAAHAEHYGRIVKDAATKRSLISAASVLTESAFDESREISDLLDEAEKNVFSLSQQNLRNVFISIKDALAESFDRLDELHKNAGGLRGVPTGFADIDDALAGMQPSNLVVLAARPSVGKTALALNIAQYVAVQQKLPVGFFSLEMSREELVDRLLVSQANIDAWRLKTGRLGEEEFSALSDAMGVLADAPLFIDDTPGLSILEMRTKARRLMAEHGLKLIVVDYLQLVHGRKNAESRVVEVTEISQGLKNLARELKVPVLALSQLSRAVETRGGTKQPQLADLRESGAIEQDADVVMFLFREDDEDRENIKLSIAKHRNGPLRLIDLRFVGDKVRFFGIERKRR
ncbi:replicative DNA helicase [Microgenomates group bacterium RIFCSPLOWO2_01_FULL_47_10]|nr:MAG: replicative DNA helicase [Microgenomates group bacterium RIFCSPLOWO2_01_FULL_47_10]